MRPSRLFNYFVERCDRALEDWSDLDRRDRIFESGKFVKPLMTKQGDSIL
ncbi:hypothetical protein H6F50_12645 [Coleofasciculus sp. FACHB-712]|nr:hypothetical protein [Coleofasciculus sp. FACHB-712]MBD1943192.1 hypothetical protein [Coleofasciculus sp. FACHB-712]